MQATQKQTFPPQHQNQQPGKESVMNPLPVFDDPRYQGCGKLTGSVAIITGGDSGIGRAVAVAYAKEGADIALVYLNENSDALQTKQAVEAAGRQCVAIMADLRQENQSDVVVKKAIEVFGKIDIVINNAAVQFPQTSILNISKQQLRDTFETNIFSYFYLTKAALPHLHQGSSIINTTSVTAFEGHEQLIDYSATKGAIVTFTRSLALSLAKQGIRVNAVAPGPIWTPLIVSSFPAEQVKTFGTNTPMGRAGQPYELAPAYVFLACSDASYISGQVIHINGGQIVGS